MQEWEKRVKPVPWEWLLEESNPSVRYFTLCQLLDLSIDSKEVISACERIMQIGPALKILAKQHPDGYWGKSVNYYVNAKYKGTAHTMLILAQLGVSQEDKRIKHMCEFILEVAQDPISGGFSCSPSSTGHGDQRNLEPCFTGNMTWALIQLGYLADPRVLKAINWITTTCALMMVNPAPRMFSPIIKKTTAGVSIPAMPQSLEQLKPLQPSQSITDLKKWKVWLSRQPTICSNIKSFVKVMI